MQGIKKFVKKDYKNELEEVLENKYFGENAKSLLLEILYKIETAYKDYEIVKKDVKTKDEYIQSYINSIKKNCKTIKIVKPNSEQSKLLDGKTFTINKKRNEIMCLPIARKLLYAISKLEKKERIVNAKYYLLSKTLTNLINIGDCINTVEPLREFNGWSWTTVTRELESPEYNLIYQVLLILVGKKLMQDWVTNGDSIIDYVEELENKLTDEFEEKISKKILQIINELSILMEYKVNPSIKNDIENSKRNIATSLEKFENKQLYIQELTMKKNKLQKKILQIDTTISNSSLLQEEYVERNKKLSLEEKIFSIRVLANIMIEEREALFKEMEECNALLKPKNFIQKREELQKEYNILHLVDLENEESLLNKDLIELQELFLECFKIKIEKAETKQDIINLMYRFRYYCLLPYNLNENIFELKEIQKKLNQVGKLLIKKATDTKNVPMYSQNEDINYEIMKNVFKVRIVSLEELSMKLLKEKDGFFIQFFDDKVSDQKIRLTNLYDLSKRDLNISFNKKVKLFE